MSAALPAPEEEVLFSTSGHTGEPAVWARTGEQLCAEGLLLAALLPGAVDTVVNYAPPRHLYGYLMGKVLPAILDVPVQHLWEDPFTPPDLTSGKRVLLACLPSSWAVVRRFSGRLRSLPGVFAFHGAGPVTEETGRTARVLESSGFQATELLGATETGAVAYRPLAPRPADPERWTPFPDVDLKGAPVPGGEQPLVVSSPRLARPRGQACAPEAIALDDVVRPLEGGGFSLVGRSTSLVKVNGRRLYLSQIETALRKKMPRLDVVCVPRSDAIRAEHYDLYYVGSTVGEAEVRKGVAAALPDAPQPRGVHRVRRIPRSMTGKVRLDLLLAADHVVSAGTVPAVRGAPRDDLVGDADQPADRPMASEAASLASQPEALFRAPAGHVTPPLPDERKN
ncbi:class I adenylate-forming enzyme family protein [Nocardiopsis deserti]|uniref:long-chain fatty acid--CoA ligase n=1 Tax=Nocardiopsis deserti TaxID=2605988 RepID=UPI0012392CDC|nr:long-chain fatty acid--CoA ligase [Nocardiopsis deserti]